MKKLFIAVLLLFFVLVNVSSQDQEFLDFVGKWNKASYSEESMFSNHLIMIKADYKYDGKNFTYVANIASETKNYIQENSNFDKEFIEEFPDIPVPRCFFQDNHPIKEVPYYFIDEMIRKYYPEVEIDTDSYITMANLLLDYCREYKDPFLIIASVDHQFYIYYEPLDEFIRIFAP